MAADHLVDDRQPEAGAWLAAHVDGPVEAIEDPPEVVRGDAPATVADGQARPVDVDLDDRRRIAVLHRVVDQVADRPLHLPWSSVDHQRVVLDDDDLAVGAALDPRRGRAGQVAEPQRLGVLGGGEVAGQLDELLEECGELADVLEHVADDLAALGGVEPLDALEELEVAGQAGEWGAHLVAGVGHEPPLLRLGAGDLGDHRLEARRQVGDLAGAAGVDRCRQVERGGDPVRRVAQACDRTHQARRHRPAERSGDHHCAGDERGELPAQAGEQIVRLGKAAGDLQDATMRPRDGQDAVLLAVDRHGLQRRRGARRREVRGIDGRQGRAASDAHGDGAVGGHQLRGRRRLEQPGDRAVTVVGPAIRAPTAAIAAAVLLAFGGDDTRGPIGQRLVDARTELGRGAEVRHGRCGGADAECDGRQDQRDPPAQRHG